MLVGLAPVSNGIFVCKLLCCAAVASLSFSATAQDHWSYTRLKTLNYSSGVARAGFKPLVLDRKHFDLRSAKAVEVFGAKESYVVLLYVYGVRSEPAARVEIAEGPSGTPMGTSQGVFAAGVHEFYLPFHLPSVWHSEAVQGRRCISVYALKLSRHELQVLVRETHLQP